MSEVEDTVRHREAGGKAASPLIPSLSLLLERCQPPRPWGVCRPVSPFAFSKPHSPSLGNPRLDQITAQLRIGRFANVSWGYLHDTFGLLFGATWTGLLSNHVDLEESPDTTQRLNNHCDLLLHNYVLK